MFLFISMTYNALCNKSNGRCDIKAEKREELESKSSHKSDIWPPAASKKWGEIYWKYIFQTLEAIFPYKGVFFTKVVKANIIAFIKTKILRPVLSVTNPPFQKCQPLLHSAMWFHAKKLLRTLKFCKSLNSLYKSGSQPQKSPKKKPKKRLAQSWFSQFF